MLSGDCYQPDGITLKGGAEGEEGEREGGRGREGGERSRDILHPYFLIYLEATVNQDLSSHYKILFIDADHLPSDKQSHSILHTVV